MSSSRRLRPAVRRAARHLALASFVAVSGGVVVLLLDSDRLVFELSMASAYVGLVLLAVTLLLGPLNVLRGVPNPVSTHLRRDVGVWAALVAVFHVIVGLQVHLGGAVEAYFFFSRGRGGFPVRYDAFGLGNWLGLGATIIALVLLTISNDASVRALGLERWKGIQRWNYALFAMVVGHALLYQIIEGRTAPWVAVVVVVGALVAGLQFAGYRARRRFL